MRKAIIFGIVGLAIGLMVAVVTGYTLSANSTSKTIEPTVSQLLTLVNAERAKNHIEPLKEDLRLDESAQYKASDMQNRNYYSHLDPVTGKNSHDIIFATGIKCVDSSENLEENTSDATAVTAWIASPSHHKAMIDPKYSLTGFGIAGKDKHGYYLFVEHFCQTQ